MMDFVCIGDATRDLFLFLKETPVFDGSKIPVDNIAWSLGGNAANVSVGLSRLGIKTNLVTVFGDDDRGAWIKRELLKNNVNLDFSLIQNHQSNLSAVIVSGGERTIFSYHGGELDEVKNIPEAKWAYLTSAVTINIPAEKIAFNPSMKEIKNGSVLPVVQKTDVLIVNKEEMEALGAKGPKITVVTDGKNGVTLYEGDKVLQKAALGNKAYEPTGAGDAFSSGFLAGLYYGMKPEDALDWGLKNSASVIQKIGAIEGLLTKDVILEAEGR